MQLVATANPSALCLAAFLDSSSLFDGRRSGPWLTACIAVRRSCKPQSVGLARAAAATGSKRIWSYLSKACEALSLLCFLEPRGKDLTFGASVAICWEACRTLGDLLLQARQAAILHVASWSARLLLASHEKTAEPWEAVGCSCFNNLTVFPRKQPIAIKGSTFLGDSQVTHPHGSSGARTLHPRTPFRAATVQLQAVQPWLPRATCCWRLRRGSWRDRRRDLAPPKAAPVIEATCMGLRVFPQLGVEFVEGSKFRVISRRQLAEPHNSRRVAQVHKPRHDRTE